MPDPMEPDEEFEVVFETMDATEAAVIKTLLEGASIPYFTRGEDAFDAFRGAFRGTVFGSQARPITFLVPAAAAREAVELIGEPPSLDDK